MASYRAVDENGLELASDCDLGRLRQTVRRITGAAVNVEVWAGCQWYRTSVRFPATESGIRGFHHWAE
jgi:hypothetical protein